MVHTHEDGSIEFRVYLPHAGRVEVVATFTDWRERPVAMTRSGPGWWHATIAVPEGDHTFSYLVDGTLYLADYAAHGVTLNPYGGWVSRLTVPADVRVVRSAA